MAKQSLFSHGVTQAPTTPAGLLSQMPAESGGLDAVKPRDEGPFSPYVEFATTGKGRWDAIKEAVPAVADADPILRVDGEYSRQVPLIFFLVDGFQYFATLDADYKPNRAWREKPANAPDKVHEYIQALVVVMTATGPVAATMRVRDGLCRGVGKSIAARTEASSAEWAGKSADHAITMKITDPRFRYKTELRPGHSVSKASGRSYQVTTGKILPTSAADLALLHTLDNEQLGLVVAEFISQKQKIESLISKG